MFCRQCGFEVEPGQLYCRNCGAPLGYGDEAVRSVPESRVRPSGRSRKGAVALVAVLVIVAALAVVWTMGSDDIQVPTDDPDAEIALGEVTLRGGMAAEDIVMTSGTGGVTLEYSGDGTPTWLWRDSCAPVFTQVNGLYGENPFQSSGSDTVTFTEPGKYEVTLQVDGVTFHTGYVIVDGEVDRTWTWSRSVGTSTATYTVDWSFQFSDYLGYREDDAYRASNEESDARFVVVDEDILSLEQALSDAYAAVHGYEPVEGSQDYADYLLSFVQVCFSYPPMIAEIQDGVYTESSAGSPDTYLYGAVEYWAYPMETLYMGSGDCEDTSFLACALFSAAGYESALATPPNHMMALVAVDGYQLQYAFEFYNFGMDSWHFTTSDGKVYFFCETTYNEAVPVGYNNTLNMGADLKTIRDITLVPAYSAS